MFSKFLLAWLSAILLLAGRADAQDSDVQALMALREVDEQVAIIGHRLAVANVDLCQLRKWRPGFAVHDLSQYGGRSRDAAIRAFGLDRGPAVLAVVAGGAAERAGLRPDDILVEADGRSLAAERSAGRRTFDRVEALLDMLDETFADGRAELVVLRGGERLSFAIAGDLGCASRFQAIPSRRLNAWADGRYVQVTTAISEYVRDEQELAAVLAHEFAHNVLRHRHQLDEADVARGFFGNFGRNARLIRATEAEADRLSVYLLDRAGYDPEAPIHFWSRFGRRGLNFLGSPTHPNWRHRIEVFRQEVQIVREARASGRTPVPAFMSPVAPGAADGSDSS